jgi:hypothetical protein
MSQSAAYHIQHRTRLFGEGIDRHSPHSAKQHRSEYQGRNPLNFRENGACVCPFVVHGVPELEDNALTIAMT